MENSAKQLAVVLLLALASAMIVTAQNSKQDMVDAHNAVRASVGVGPVS
jgi:pathogenesis-related protein 1